MTKKLKIRGSEASQQVGFKLETDALVALQSRADALGTSHHLLAKQYVILALAEDESRRALVKTLDALLGELIELRKDCALSTESLLVSAGHANEDEARTWVLENFRRK